MRNIPSSSTTHKSFWLWNIPTANRVIITTALCAALMGSPRATIGAEDLPPSRMQNPEISTLVVPQKIENAVIDAVQFGKMYPALYELIWEDFGESATLESIPQKIDSGIAEQINNLNIQKISWENERSYREKMKYEAIVWFSEAIQDLESLIELLKKTRHTLSKTNQTSQSVFFRQANSLVENADKVYLDMVGRFNKVEFQLMRQRINNNYTPDDVDNLSISKKLLNKRDTKHIHLVA